MKLTPHADDDVTIEATVRPSFIDEATGEAYECVLSLSVLSGDDVIAIEIPVNGTEAQCQKILDQVHPILYKDAGPALLEWLRPEVPS